jgi:uncharacterized tellurite resistance protein B-like protein
MWTFGLLLLALGIYVIARAMKREETEKHWIAQSRSESRPTLAAAPSTSGLRITIATSFGERVGRSGLQPIWHGCGQTLTVGHYQITDPLTYACNEPTEFDEASCIDLGLGFGEPMPEPIGALGYWPSFRRMSPSQRGNYLQWLSAGKSDPSVDIGYVFVYYYGLERRALVDRQDCSLIIGEVLRLRQVYARSYSFDRYSSSFLVYLLASELEHNGAQRTDLSLGDAASDRNDPEFINCALVQLARSSEFVPAELARRIALIHPRAIRSVVATRLPKEFAELFQRRYRDRSLDTRKLMTTGVMRQVGYHCASATIGSGYARIEVPPVQIPDVLGQTAPVSEYVDIWNECIEELKPVSRKIASGLSIDSREAFEALPAELRSAADHPDEPKWRALTEASSHEEGYALVEVGRLAALLDIERRERLTLKQSRDLSETAQHVGYVVEPDGRIMNTAYDWDALVALFHDDDILERPTEPKFVAACLVLQLGLWIAAADGQADPDELRMLSGFIGDLFNLAPHESKRLEMQRRVLLVRPADPSRLSKHLQNSLTASQRWKLGELLVAISVASNGVSDAERRALRKVYRLLGLSVEQLDTVLESLVPDHDELATVRPAKPGVPGELIPPRPKESSTLGVHLSADRLREILENTREVTAILAQVFVDEATVLPAQTPVTADSKNEGRYPGLQERYYGILDELSQKEVWTTADFDAAVAHRAMMRVDVVEKLNNWSDEALGDFLILEEAGQVHVQTKLLEKQE